jgi:N-hydroxyarylamine O-acetyltransferase
MGKTAELSTDLLERVLMKLGLPYRPAPTLDGLRILYAAWCRHVPFDNVRKLIHIHQHNPAPLPGDEATDFFENWLTYGTGGTCWVGNGALQALLVSLGFQASRGVGTMLVAPNVPPNHGTVLVVCEAMRYVVDASILHNAPLRLEVTAPTAVPHAAWGVQCSMRQEQWHIRWRPLHTPEGMDCRLEQLEVTRETFQERHEHTRPWSPFNYELNARLLWGDAVVGATGGQRVALDSTGGVLRQPLTGDDRIRLLVDELGMHEEIVRQLPLDTPTPPPPWSRTAQRAAMRS